MTDSAHAFDDAYWVYGDKTTAKEIWESALLGLPVTQALMQGLHGRGPISFAGAHHLLARHRFAAPTDVAGVRALLQTLNAAGIVAYSNKLQSVRVLAPLPEEFAAVVRVVEP